MGSREDLANIQCNLSAMCGTYFGNSSWQKSTVCPYVGRGAVTFKLHGPIRTYVYGKITTSYLDRYCSLLTPL